MASISIQGSIQFQSNSTKEQSCHIIGYTLVDVNGNILTSNLGRWLRVVAIRPKNTSDVVLPGNTNPFVYNINETFNLIDCNFVGCNIFLRVYVIPCCRINQDVTGSILNDPNNPLYDIVDLTTNGTFNPPITSLGNDGYAYKDVLLHNPAMYRCKKFKFIPVSSGVAMGSDVYFLLTNPTKNKCNLTSSMTGTTPISVNSLLNTTHSNIPLNNMIVCLSSNTTEQSTSRADMIDVTDKTGICCNTCRNYSFSSFNIPDGQTLVIVYQVCDGGNVAVVEVTGPTNYTQTYCAVEGSFFAYLWNGTTYTSATYNVDNSTNCRNCPNLL